MYGNIDRPTELINCNFVKTILMISVVLYHSMLFWGGEWFNESPIYSARIFVKITGWLNSFHTYGFTLTSGYIFYYLRCEEDRYSKFSQFILNKIRRLLIPYIFATIFWVVPITGLFFKLDIMSVIKNYFFAISPSQLWFLIMLFNIFVLFWILTNCLKKYNFIGLIIVIIFYFIGLLGSHFLPNIIQIWSTCLYLIYFWLGFKIRQYGNIFVYKIPLIIWCIVDIVLFLILGKFFINSSVFLKLINVVIEIIIHSLGAIISFYILQNIANFLKKHIYNNIYVCMGGGKIIKIYNLLSKNFMPIYLFHQQVIYFMITLLNGVIHPFFHIIINFVVAILVSLSISLWLKKISIARILLGEKNNYVV